MNEAKPDDLNGRVTFLEGQTKTLEVTLPAFLARMDMMEQRLDQKLDQAIRGSKWERIGIMITMAASAASIVTAIALSN